MVTKKEWSCWEITGCGCQNHCRAARQGEMRPCWELAAEIDDYRSALNVCGDCIVYVSKHRDSFLSEEEVRQIVSSKVHCVLADGPREAVGG